MKILNGSYGTTVMIASEFRGKKYVFRALEMRYGDFSKRGPMIVQKVEDAKTHGRRRS